MSVYSETPENLRTNFAGNDPLMFIYFLEKYKNVCLGQTTYLSWDDNIKNLKLSSDFIERLQLCRDNGARFVIGTILLIWNGDAHHNSFVYDIKENAVELFEPHGKSGWTSPEYLNVLEDLFKKIDVDKFYKPNDFCPIYSLQILQDKEGRMMPTDPGGFCQSWSHWWIEHRISNPDKSREELLKETLRDIKELTPFIRKYATKIVKIRTKLIRRMFDKKSAEEIIQYLGSFVQGDPINFNIVNKLYDKSILELEKLTPTYRSAKNSISECEIRGCPENRFCRHTTGRCVVKKYAQERVEIRDGIKVLVNQNTSRITPTLDNFSQVYIREYIFHNFAHKLTKDQIHMVLFYKTPINGANKYWEMYK